MRTGPMAGRLVQRFRDLLEDMRISVGRSPGRSAVLGSGAALACGMLAFSIVDSSTQASRVTDRFDELAARRLQVDLPLNGGTYRRFSAEQVQALRQTRGVEGVAWAYQSDRRITSHREPHWNIDAAIRVFDVSGDTAVLELGFGTDAPPSEGLWLGSAIDVIGPVPANAVVEVDGRPTMTRGTIQSSELITEVLTSALRVVPGREVDLRRKGRLVVGVAVGQADAVATSLQSQLEPLSPNQVLVRYRPESAILRRDVTTRVDALVLVVTLCLLLSSAVAVGLATLARTLERRRLIGLCRAIGASRMSIVAALTVEAAVVGAIAGSCGGLAGMVVAVAAQAGEPVVLPWRVVGLAVAAAICGNGMAAAIPAWHATRTAPAQAIRES